MYEIGETVIYEGKTHHITRKCHGTYGFEYLLEPGGLWVYSSKLSRPQPETKAGFCEFCSSDGGHCCVCSVSTPMTAYAAASSPSPN